MHVELVETAGRTEVFYRDVCVICEHMFASLHVTKSRCQKMDLKLPVEDRKKGTLSQAVGKSAVSQ